MGVENIKDNKGTEHMVLSNEDFYNDDIMGDKLEDYEILQIKQKDISPKCRIIKVLSKLNSKIYAIRVMDQNLIEQGNINKNLQELEMLKEVNHPNVAKFFKFFKQGEKYNFIYEYFDFCNLDDLYKAHQFRNNPIVENDVWTYLFQCFSGLNYLHSNNVIHKNLNPANIYLTNDKVAKLGDVKPTFLVGYKQYNKAKDINDLGKTFFKLCHFCEPSSTNVRNVDYYSQDLENIIQNLMNNNDGNTYELFNIIKNYYITKVAKLTSIESVFRCLFSFTNFANDIFQLYSNKSTINQNSIVNIIQSCFQLNFLDISKTYKILNNFRILYCEKNNLNNESEINPSLALDYLLELLNKEASYKNNIPSFKTQEVQFNENKDVAFTLCQKNFNNNCSPILLIYFINYIKTKRNCKTCRYGRYSFSGLPYLEFDLDKYNGELKLEKMFSEQRISCFYLDLKHNIYCQSQNCHCLREHFEFKQFYMLPKYLIISFKRGDGYKNKSQIQYPYVLDLKSVVEKQGNYNIYNLTGVIRLKRDEEGNEYFISLYYDSYQKSWILSDRGKSIKINGPQYEKDELAMILFYSAQDTPNTMG